MMHHIFNRVIVVLNDLERIDTLLKKAVDFSIQHQTILEILYVHEEPLFELPDFFRTDDKIAERQMDKAKIKKEIQTRLNAFNLTKECAILVYIDDTVNRLLTHAKDAEHTLIMTNYHEHLTKSLIEKTTYSYWIMKGNQEHYENIVLPIDLKEHSRTCIQATQHIFPNSKLSLVYDYRYILDVLALREDYLNVVPLTTGVDMEFNEELKAQQKETFDAYVTEFNATGYFMEGEGLLDEDLIAYIQKEGFDLTVLYHNDEELFFSPTLILDLLEELSTDFLICKP